MYSLVSADGAIIRVGCCFCGVAGCGDAANAIVPCGAYWAVNVCARLITKLRAIVTFRMALDCVGFSGRASNECYDCQYGRLFEQPESIHQIKTYC